MPANNLTSAITGNDGFWNLFSYINTSSNYFLVYAILLLIFITAAFFFIKKTQDNAKSLLSSGYIIFILSLILYYAGKTSGITVIPDLAMLTILVMVTLGTAGLRYARNKI